MAHSALHFTLGLAVGGAVALRPVVRAWRAGGRVAPALRRWMLVSYAVGAAAIVPALLRWAGVPAQACDGPWMNVFVGYPWLNRLLPREGMPYAAVALAASFAVQYGLILLAILRQTRRAKPSGS